MYKNKGINRKNVQNVWEKEVKIAKNSDQNIDPGPKKSLMIVI
jgi:hypothetical protein